MRSLPALALIFAALLSLSGCGLLPEQKDETAGWSANKLYTQAKEAMSEGSWDKAVKYFEKLESRYPYGRYAQQAQIEVAYAYFKSGETASAIAACDRFVKLHPDHPNVDYIYYLKGLVTFNEDLGMMGHVSMQDQTERDPKGMRESFDAFKTLSSRFPDSKYTPDAVQRMKYLVSAMAANEVHVARYYMKRKAYVAAANRAQSAIKNYPDAPAIEEALFIMVKAYDEMGMIDLRDDAERVMRKNYPNSVYYTRGLNRVEPWWKLW
ncbi:MULTISPECIES: outer membrane protein assembly factor BamD [Azospira]|jgi:outer membrane protein assembly factor BamD|uniref:Outer membrane protein assembly factor BamD n=2 Tax=Azospira oryzae TaxID=146939 RepID=G8QN40_AZOOP|nr:MULTISPECIES: outer membrane protein assembly factor BamD [Azospira]TLS19745.1 MAG: outer membrane protein assembly factor BamD [Betaproteobacteria bacterium]AEV26880.1 outer membrane assembly lipoprotein YfiO [Azospira oryzae PS]MBP7489479.1 outer membrane protein assembly factor BamD [Azospira sp.]MDK9692530.1 outer membrane protein assembly factor BamD [Azospira sp.]RZT89873.1 Beta-barrel assembly machine subunit BamD [Azospira oryzae]